MGVGLLTAGGAAAQMSSIFVQCPTSANGDAIPDPICPADSITPNCIGNEGLPNIDYDPDVQCQHIGGGDGFISMSDVTKSAAGDRGTPLYIFSFSELSDTKTPQEAMDKGRLGAQFPAPTIEIDQGKDFYLTLTNVSMAVRADLFDEHTVHFHGFPNAAPVFDGVPDNSISIGMGASLTYFYRLVDEGTYMYHCHVEATEHMQMGMLGNLYVKAAQNRLPGGTALNDGFTHQTGFEYAYSDGDGSTYYDVDYPIQIGNFDPNFHHASYLVQPLPFGDMRDLYPMLNGRGYSETIIEAPLSTDPGTVDGWDVKPETQPMNALVKASPGEKVLLRVSNLNVTQFNTLTTTLGIPMQVVGRDARHLRPENYYKTNSLTLGGGQSYDVILDIPSDHPTGTYFLYTTNMYNLSNNEEDFGGMMTEIWVSP